MGRLLQRVAGQTAPGWDFDGRGPGRRPQQNATAGRKRIEEELQPDQEIPAARLRPVELLVPIPVGSRFRRHGDASLRAITRASTRDRLTRRAGRLERLGPRDAAATARSAEHAGQGARPGSISVPETLFGGAQTCTPRHRSALLPSEVHRSFLSVSEAGRGSAAGDNRPEGTRSCRWEGSRSASAQRDLRAGSAWAQRGRRGSARGAPFGGRTPGPTVSS